MLMPKLPTRARRFAFVASVGAVTLFTAGASMQSPRFYPDDPIARAPESQDASKAAPYNQSQMYELVYNLFVNPGYVPSGLRAKNINTIDEVPDSSWFTNRVGSRELALEDVLRGPAVGPPPDPSKWTITREKSAGAAPGFTAKDASGQTYFVSFDAPSNPDGATAALVVSTKIFWALGYNQVEYFLTTFNIESLEIAPDATKRRPSGRRTPLTRDDVR